MSVIEQTQPVQTVVAEKRRRVVALDAARGYAASIMLFGPLFQALDSLGNNAFVHTLRVHLTTHTKWNGLRYFDFGFPFYLHAVGIAIALSLSRRLDEPNKSGIYVQVFKRTALLLVLGFLLNGGFRHEWPDVRLVGILQRIAVCYCLGAIVFLNLRLRSQIALLMAILLGYWALLAWLPSSDLEANYSYEGNLAAYLDQWLLGGRKVFGTWDPEGLLSTLGAFASCLAGILTGQFFRLSKASPQENAIYLMLAGLLCAAAGLLWSEWLPINKKMWTSSFVLVSAGNSLSSLAVFYQIADVWQKPKWLFPLVVVGVNTLVAFIAVQVLPFDNVALRIAGGDIQSLLGPAGPMLVGFTQGLLGWLLLYWLYRCGILLKA